MESRALVKDVHRVTLACSWGEQLATGNMESSCQLGRNTAARCGQMKKPIKFTGRNATEDEVSCELFVCT